MAGEPRFVVDVNVGRLAKWLRVMGYDTRFPREESDNELVRIALREGRVLVTRDSTLAQRRAVRLGQMQVLYIVKDDLRSQLRQLVQDLNLNPENGFSRCVRCNQLLCSVAKAEVVDSVPPYVGQTQCQFMRCPACQRIYWRGTHWSNMVAELAEVFQEGG